MQRHTNKYIDVQGYWSMNGSILVGICNSNQISLYPNQIEYIQINNTYSGNLPVYHLYLKIINISELYFLGVFPSTIQSFRDQLLQYAANFNIKVYQYGNLLPDIPTKKKYGVRLFFAAIAFAFIIWILSMVLFRGKDISQAAPLMIFAGMVIVIAFIGGRSGRSNQDIDNYSGSDDYYHSNDHHYSDDSNHWSHHE